MRCSRRSACLSSWATAWRITVAGDVNTLAGKVAALVINSLHSRPDGFRHAATAHAHGGFVYGLLQPTGRSPVVLDAPVLCICIAPSYIAVKACEGGGKHDVSAGERYEVSSLRHWCAMYSRLCPDPPDTELMLMRSAIKAAVRSCWACITVDVKGRSFTKRNGEAGWTRFRIESDSHVYQAMR